MSLLLTLVIGAIVGWIASTMLKSSSGIIMDVVLGIVGAVVGSFIMNMLEQPGTTGFNIYSILVSLLGAIAIIWIGRILTQGTAYS